MAIAGFPPQRLTPAQVGVDPSLVMTRYPNQFLGGTLQRAGIAMAIASNPTLLVLDEPTTGLDATVEAEVLDLIRHPRRKQSITILFIATTSP